MSKNDLKQTRRVNTTAIGREHVLGYAEDLRGTLSQGQRCGPHIRKVTQVALALLGEQTPAVSKNYRSALENRLEHDQPPDKEG